MVTCRPQRFAVERRGSFIEDVETHRWRTAWTTAMHVRLEELQDSLQASSRPSPSDEFSTSSIKNPCARRQSAAPASDHLLSADKTGPKMDMRSICRRRQEAVPLLLA